MARSKTFITDFRDLPEVDSDEIASGRSLAAFLAQETLRQLQTLAEAGAPLVHLGVFRARKPPNATKYSRIM